jgi:hypothetical protein
MLNDLMMIDRGRSMPQGQFAGAARPTTAYPVGRTVN